MKQCKACGEVKTLDDFPFNGFQPSGKKKTKPECKKCYNKTNYTLFHEKVTSILAETNRLLECEMCGYSKNLAALTFHHLDPEEKENSISAMKTASISRLRNEIEKCVILCANCHVEEHNPHLSIVVDD